MKQKKSHLNYVIFTLFMVFSVFLSHSSIVHATNSENLSYSTEHTDTTEKSDDIVILYTNDIHSYIDKELSYDVIAGLKTYLKTQYEHVLLVDAGDHIQGTAYGSMDKGKTVIDLMNASGYDLSVLGNHEFDFGMEGRITVTDTWSKFPYVSCNFYHEKDNIRGDNVFDSYKLFDLGHEKLAIIGITTPETLTSTTPVYFQDASGNYIYGISGGNNGLDLYADVQNAIDNAKKDGATHIIALAHLGDDLSAQPYTSEETIANTSGLDALIDGHSHNTIVGKYVKDETEKNVILTQTGSYFDSIGMMLIDSETGEITTELLGADHPLIIDSPVDETVKSIKDSWILEINDRLGTVIGTSEVALRNHDDNGNRLVRSQETNCGSFVADALYYLFDHMGMDVDIAISNGGGIRNNNPITGALSYQTCKEINPFGNVACLQTVKGQQILDALEWGSRLAPTVQVGGFLQVSGIRYEIDTTIESTVQSDDKGIWTGPPTSEYRVKNVTVYNKETHTFEPLQLNASYNLAGLNYTLRDLGDGFAMFDGAINVLDYVMEDYMVLSNYIQGFENATIKADNSPLNIKYPGLNINYADVNGDGRIHLLLSEENEERNGKITIGGLENDVWFTKYGNVFTDCTSDNFTNGLNFTWGDMVTVKFLEQELTLPVVPTYTYVESGQPAVILKRTDEGLPTGYISLAINMGNFGETLGIGIKKTDDNGNWYWEAADGVEFPVEVSFTLAEKEGYMAEYLLHDLTRTNNREDYPALTDETFANFREIKTSGIKAKTLYRSSSPIDPSIGRNLYADAALKKAGVTVIMNLTDAKETALTYPDFENSYYSKQNVIYLNLGVDFTSSEFKSGLAKGLRFFAENKGIYAIHCTEGKDRAGFVHALLQCLTGASYNEVIEDYMETYSNYYGVEKNSEKYHAIAKSNIIKSLETAFELDSAKLALSNADLAHEAADFLKSIGLTIQEIDALKANLCEQSIDETQKNETLDEAQTESSNKETKPAETKPNASPSTGDQTPTSILTSILLSSIIALGITYRKMKQ